MKRLPTYQVNLNEVAQLCQRKADSFILWVFVKPDSKREALFLDSGQLKLQVAAPACDNKANRRVIEILADFFRVPKSRISIMSGANSSRKKIQIERLVLSESNSD